MSEAHWRLAIVSTSRLGEVVSKTETVDGMEVVKIENPF
jgi:hypothetical protein